MDEKKKLEEHWEQVLESEGLKVLGDNDRSKKQIPMANKPVDEDSKLSRENFGGGFLATYEYYSMLKHYCEQNRYIFPECGQMSLRQRSYLKAILRAYCEGVSVSQSYKMLRARARNINLVKPKSRIYFFKKIQLIKKSFIAEFGLFSRYMIYLKYSWSSNPKSWKTFRELETFLPGYHDEP